MKTKNSSGFDGKGLSGNVTREGLLAAMNAYDADRTAFHAAHGTSDAGKYFIKHDGKSYPSKAIVAAAADLHPSKFSGGKGRLGNILRKAGFKLGLLMMIAAAPSILEGAHPGFAKQNDSVTIEGRYFASGSNRPGHIRGFKAIRQAIGVAAPEVKEASENELHALAGTNLPVFVDSGAFSEVEFNAPHKCSKKATKCLTGACIGSGNLPRTDLPVGVPFVVKPITKADWQRVLDLYNRLGTSLGSQLWVVAPDKVGFQKETLERLAEWKEELEALRSMGVNIIVVSQKGPGMNQAEFDKKAEEILGFGDYVRGLPCKKNATSLKELEHFVASRKPQKLHLLGLGIRNGKAPKAAAIVAKHSPETALSFDSCLINESMGKTNGRANHHRETLKGRRVLEQGKDKARELIQKGVAITTCVQELAIMLTWGAVA